METIGFGARKRIDYKNVNLEGLDFNFYMVATAVDTDIIDDNMDFDQTSVDIKLKQDGVESVIFSGPLGVVVQEGNFLTGKWEYCKAAGRSPKKLLEHAQ
jgi:hypothetical protein